MVALRDHPDDVQLAKLVSLGGVACRAIMRTVDPRTGTIELTEENIERLLETLIDGARELDLIR